MTMNAPVGDLSQDQELRCPFGAGPAAAPGSRPRPKRGYLIPGIIALIVCAAIAVVIDVAGLQSHTPDTLSASQSETLVSGSLVAEDVPGTQHRGNPPDVRCPASEPVRAGLSFDCTLLRTGRPPAAVHVTEISGDGSLNVTLGAHGAAPTVR